MTKVQKPIPTPRADEKEDDFIGRCISEISDEHPQDQATAICYTKWREKSGGVKKSISLHFHPYEFEKKFHAVEKDVDGKKRRYLYGIATGLDQDLDGERLTENCIESLQKQAKSGQILLMSDLHGKGATEDIGMLTDSKILENGDWWIEARLYDESDNIGPVKLEKASDLWKQVNGIDPYVDPKQKGFSIEGFLTDLEKVDSKTGGRIINDMDLDYMAVVPRPAYKDSIAHAIAKSLGAKTEWVIKKNITNKIDQKRQTRKKQENFSTEKWELESVLEELIDEIMSSDSMDKYRELDNTLDEFKDALIKLLMKYENVFLSHDSASETGQINKMNEWKEQILKRIQTAKARIAEQKT